MRRKLKGAFMASLLLPILVLAANAANPVAVELFTSQSCSSCPAAEAALARIAERPDVVALEWHVDYWDDLSVGSAGRWKDPYSDPSHTARQRVYNQRLVGKPNGYTPQAVVNGAAETIGSREASVHALIDAAADAPARASVTATRGTSIRFSVESAPAGAEALLVTFEKSPTTRVGGGENHGRVLPETNVVIAARSLGAARAGAAFEIDPPADGEGCAILIQDGRAGRVLAARYCPS